ncbi:MAG: FadR family transcriptional regulator [Anaerolineae bacterium]|nr:FadR family transcriptional regulator [Anaerolineae bacterium]
MSARPRRAKPTPAPLKPLERPPALHYAVQESIKNYITEHRLQPGEPILPETVFARQLGISRNAVREAVKALEMLGIVETRHGSGLFVGQFSFAPLLDSLPYGLMSDLQQLADLLEIRRVLETGMIAQVMAMMTPQQLTHLNSLVEQMHTRAVRGEPFFEEDREFHRRLFEPLNNQVLLRLLDSFWLAFRKASEQADIRDTDPLRTYRDHAAILEAVVAGDVARAQTALDQHYGGLQGRLARVRDARQSQPPTEAS